MNRRGAVTIKMRSVMLQAFSSILLMLHVASCLARHCTNIGFY